MTLLEKIYLGILVVVFGGIVLHAPLSVGFGTLFPGYGLLIKSWKEVLLLVATVLAVVIVSRLHLWKKLASDVVFQIIVGYAALHILLAAIFYKGATQTAAGLAIDLRYVLFFGLVYILVRLVPESRRLLLRVGTIGAFVVVGFAVLQLFLPPDILKYIGYGKDTIEPYLTVDKNHEYIRVNSTLRGPNPLGAYVGIILAAFAAAWVRGRVAFDTQKDKILVTLFAACCLIALWISYSRSALVAALVAIGIVAAIVSAKYLTRRAWAAIGIAILVLAGALFVAKDSTFVSNVLLHENPNGGSRVSSNDGHVESLETSTRAILAKPFGAGIGSTGSASLQGDAPFIIENQYLFVAHEAGWLGFGLFIALFGIILTRLWKFKKDWLALGVFASGIGLGLVGLLQPVWVDDTVSIIWWGLAAIALAGGKNVRQQAKQKTARTA